MDLMSLHLAFSPLLGHTFKAGDLPIGEIVGYTIRKRGVVTFHLVSHGEHKDFVLLMNELALVDNNGKELTFSFGGQNRNSIVLSPPDY